jgi:hypothetical protein
MYYTFLRDFLYLSGSLLENIHQTIKINSNALRYFFSFAALKINVKQHKNIDFSEKKKKMDHKWIFSMLFFFA